MGAALKERAVLTGVSGVGRDEPDRAMAVFLIIPSHETGDPVLRIRLACEPRCRPIRPVLAGAEQGFGERVIVADPRPAVGGNDTKPFEGGLHGGALHRTAIVGMQHERADEAALGPDRLAHEIGGVLSAFARVNLPGHDLSAEDVEDQVQVEEHAPDWTGHPGDVPAPDLAGAAGAVAGRRFATHRRLGPAAMVLLLCRPQDAVEAGLGRDIAALVRQAGHDLAGRQALEGLAVADLQHGPALRRRQRVAGCWPSRRRAAILWRAVPGLPAPTGAGVDPELCAGRGAARAGGLGLVDQRDGVLAIWGADHASSRSPQIAAAFFLSTSSAAASARAFSLRASSRSRVLICFLSSLVAWPSRWLLARSQSFACSQAVRQVWIFSG